MLTGSVESRYGGELEGFAVCAVELTNMERRTVKIRIPAIQLARAFIIEDALLRLKRLDNRDTNRVGVYHRERTRILDSWHCVV